MLLLHTCFTLGITVVKHFLRKSGLNFVKVKDDENHLEIFCILNVYLVKLLTHLFYINDNKIIIGKYLKDLSVKIQRMGSAKKRKRKFAHL